MRGYRSWACNHERFLLTLIGTAMLMGASVICVPNLNLALLITGGVLTFSFLYTIAIMREKLKSKRRPIALWLGIAGVIGCPAGMGVIAWSKVSNYLQLPSEQRQNPQLLVDQFLAYMKKREYEKARLLLPPAQRAAGKFKPFIQEWKRLIPPGDMVISWERVNLVEKNVPGGNHMAADYEAQGARGKVQIHFGLERSFTTGTRIISVSLDG